MSALRCIVFVVACGLALGPDFVAAQGRTTMAFDATVGAGFGKGGEFYDRDLTGARIAASVRHSSSTRFGFFGELAIDALSLTSGHVAVCYFSSRGGCMPYYPELWGPTVTGGLIAQPTDRIEARLGVGGGAFIDYGTRRGAAAVVSQADVTVFPVRHVGLIAGARWVALPRYDGDRLSILPWAIGLRFR
jgi:hypothetical protein